MKAIETRTLALIVCFALLLLLPVSRVLAADITVNANCTLADAISAANRDTATGGCRAGSGRDTITLKRDVTLGAALPRISSDITIEGNDHTISGAETYQIFRVEESGVLTINHATLADGRGADDGDIWPNTLIVGGAIVNQGTLSISDSSFTGNSAEWGGVIDNVGELSISGSSFTGNSAEFGGAISNDGELSISESSFTGNSVTNYGGAIFSDGELHISDSSFRGNSADIGGGAIYNWGEASISHVTLANNSADYGGGLLVDEDSDSVRLRNSILSDNDGGDCVDLVKLAESRNNLIKDGSCLDATGMSGDPGLGAWVEPVDGSPGYFPLLAGSRAIDAGAEATCAYYDQIGAVRPHGSGCDIGAIEYLAGAA